MFLTGALSCGELTVVVPTWNSYYPPIPLHVAISSVQFPLTNRTNAEFNWLTFHSLKAFTSTTIGSIPGKMVWACARILVPAHGLFSV
jgi:hypothetical protein